MKKLGVILLTLSLIATVGCSNNKPNNSSHNTTSENISTNEATEKKEAKSYPTIEPVLKSREEITNILTNNFVPYNDEVEDYTLFIPKKNIGVFQCVVSPCVYFSDTEGDVGWLLFRYAGKDWVFFDSLIIKTDSNKYTKTFEYGEVEEETVMEGVMETVEVPFDNEMYKIIDDIAHSTKAIIRFSGKHMYDYEVTEQDKQILQQFLDCYTEE